MKFLLSARNIFTAPTVSGNGQIARNLEHFGEILEMAGIESLGCFLSVLALLLESPVPKNWMSRQALGKGFAGAWKLALRIAFVCADDTIIAYVVSSIKTAL